MGLEALVWWKKAEPWTYEEISLLWDLSVQRLPLKEIAVRVGKSESSVLRKARALEVPLEELM
jgi:hypothetical protein